MNLRNALLRILFLLSLLLSSCGNEKDTVVVEKPIASTITVVVPEDKLGGIIGKINAEDSVLSEANIYIWAANFYGNGEGGGFFLLEPEKFPKVKVESNGQFQFNNLEPGDYVLVVGSNPEMAKPILENGETKIVTVQENDVIDLGMVETSQ